MYYQMIQISMIFALGEIARLFLLIDDGIVICVNDDILKKAPDLYPHLI